MKKSISIAALRNPIYQRTLAHCYALTHFCLYSLVTVIANVCVWGGGGEEGERRKDLKEHL